MSAGSAETPGSRLRPRPNIVFILADDLGWGDPGCNNPDSLVPMPNVNAIAENGVRFLNAHAASSVCSPSRYSFLTGRYAWRTWMQEGVLYGYCRHLIEPDQPTVASMLRDAGYSTSMIGKWHVGLDWAPLPGDPGDWPSGTAMRGGHHGQIGQRVDFSQPITNGPTDVGFDYFFGTSACSTCNSPYVFIENHRPIVTPVWMSKEGVARNPVMMDPDWEHYVVDDVYVERAVEHIENHLKIRPDDPFFLYLGLSAPHAPWMPPDSAKGTSGDGPRGDMCVWADQSVGKIRAAIDHLGIRDNTLLIFTSDNGGRPNFIKVDPSNRSSDQRINGPYRGFKTDIWDGGSRVALVAEWPGRIEPGTATGVEFCLSDFLSSFASLVGSPTTGPDSFDLMDAFYSKTPETLRDNLITHSYAGVYSIRIDNWKLVLDTLGSGGDRNVTPDWAEVVPGSPGQLYNLSEDPYETVNLWDDNQETVRRLTYHVQEIRRNGRSNISSAAYVGQWK